MAAEESEYIKKTQETLGAIVKKPPLTDKLLSKPPFRFLHDVIMTVVKQSGFMDGLFTESEMDAQKVNNDKDSKIGFLQKVIDIVQMVNGENLSVKPAKVVAGQEPNRTNELLQALAKAAKQGKSAEPMVKRVLSGEKPGEFPKGSDGSGGSAGSNKENRDNDAGAKKKKDKDTSSKERGSSKDRKKDAEKDKDASKEKDKEKPKEKEKDAKNSSRSGSKTREDDSKKKREKTEPVAGGEKKESKSAGSKNDKEGDKKRSRTTTGASKGDKPRDEKTAEEAEGKSKKRHSSSAKAEHMNGDESAEKTKVKKRSSSSKAKGEKIQLDDGETGAALRINLGTSAAPMMNGTSKGANDEIDEEPDMGKFSSPENARRLASHSAAEPRRVSEDTEAALDASASNLKVGGAVRQTRSARPGSAAGVRPGTAAGARPGTAARPAPPRLKRQEIGSAPETAAAPTSEQKPVVIIGQPENTVTSTKAASQTVLEDDDFIVEAKEPMILDDNDVSALDGELDETNGEHGQLVRKILETKKELTGKTSGQQDTSKPLVVFDEKEREKTKKETAKLQEHVQQLTRTAHPLGKIVDFLQEDVDSMLKELKQWRAEAKRDGDVLRQETGKAGQQTETLKNKLRELDQQISEQSEAVTAIRGTILGNEAQIQKMLAAVAKK